MEGRCETTLRPFAGATLQDISPLLSLCLIPKHEQLMVPSLHASPSPNNLLTVVDAIWPSINNSAAQSIQSKLVLSPSLGSVHNFRPASVPAPSSGASDEPKNPLIIRIHAFSCSCMGVAQTKKAVEERLKGRLIPYDALCPHVFAMINKITLHPESIVNDKPVLDSLHLLNPQDFLAFTQTLISQRLPLDMALAHLSEAISAKHVELEDRLEKSEPVGIVDDSVIAAEAIAAARGADNFCYGTLASILPDAKAIAKILQHSISQDLSLPLGDSRYSSQQNTKFLSSPESNTWKFMHKFCPLLSQLLKFEFKSFQNPVELNGQAWLAFLEMAKVLEEDRYIRLIPMNSEFRLPLQQALHLFDDCLFKAVTGCPAHFDYMSESVRAGLQTTIQRLSRHLHHFFQDTPFPHCLARTCGFFAAPLHDPAIQSIISDSLLPRQLPPSQLSPEYFETTYHRFQHLFHQGNYLGMAKLAYVLDSFDILLHFILNDVVGKQHEGKFAVEKEMMDAMREVIYHSSGDDEDVPAYLTFARTPRNADEVSTLSRKLEKVFCSSSLRGHIGSWCFLSLVALDACPNSNPILHVLCNRELIPSLEQIFKQNQAPDLPVQAGAHVPSLLNSASATAIFSALSNPESNHEYIAFLLSGLLTLDFGQDRSSIEWRETVILSITLGLVCRHLQSLSSENKHAIECCVGVVNDLCPLSATRPLFDCLWQAFCIIITTREPYLTNSRTLLRSLENFFTLCPKRLAEPLTEFIFQTHSDKPSLLSTAFTIARTKNPLILIPTFTKNDRRLGALLSATLSRITGCGDEPEANEYLQQAFDICDYKRQLLCDENQVMSFYQPVINTLISVFEKAQRGTHQMLITISNHLASLQAEQVPIPNCILLICRLLLGHRSFIPCIFLWTGLDDSCAAINGVHYRSAILQNIFSCMHWVVHIHSPSPSSLVQEELDIVDKFVDIKREFRIMRYLRRTVSAHDFAPRSMSQSDVLDITRRCYNHQEPMSELFDKVAKLYIG